MFPKRWWIYWFGQAFSSVLFKILPWINWLSRGFLFYRLEVQGVENAYKCRGKTIFTSNHKSYADSLLILSCVSIFSRILPARAMAADWLFEIPRFKLNAKRICEVVIMFLVKHGLKSMGAYPVRKGQGLDVSLRDPLRVLRKDKKVVIFFEGGINYRYGVKPAKKGIGFLVQHSGAPVVPVALRGLEYLTIKEFFFGRRKFTVVFGKPFLPENYEKRTHEELAEEIRGKVVALYSEHQHFAC